MSRSPLSLKPTDWKWRVKVAAGLTTIVVAFTSVMSTDTKAQQNADTVLIGQLSLSDRSISEFQAFEKRLRELGFVDGQNIRIEFRGTGGKADLLPELAAELAAMPVDIIVATGPEAVLKAVSTANSTIPIVTMAGNYNSLAKGYVKSLAYSDTKVTGVYLIQVSLSAKRLAILVETMPELTHVAALWDKHTADQFQATQRATAELGIQLQSVELSDPPYDFEKAVSPIDAQAVVVLSSTNVLRQRGEIIAAMADRRLPALYIFSHFVQAGGLMAYGANLDNAIAGIAPYVAKIINGVKPRDLPMTQPTEFELVINLKAAEGLGLTLPQSIVLQATELIE